MKRALFGLLILVMGVSLSCEKPLFKKQSEKFEAKDFQEVDTQVLDTDTKNIDGIWIRTFYENDDRCYELSIEVEGELRSQKGFIHEQGSEIRFVPSSGTNFFGEISDCRQQLLVYQSVTDRSRDLLFKNMSGSH